MIKDLYSILGVDRSVGVVEIRKAYRKRALELHPDVNHSSAANKDFVELNQAYQILRNPSQRIRYDKLYDKYILNRTPKNEERFQRKEPNRRRHFDVRTENGRKRAETNAKKNPREFTKKTKKSGFWDGLWMILEIIVSIPTSLFS